jgi:hypothetical protein
MKKSIGRTLAHIDVAANTSVRIHEDFFNTHEQSRHRIADAHVERYDTNLVNTNPPPLFLP